jgi:arsenite methyltransferase
MSSAAVRCGLFGSGLARNVDGAPLRPGGRVLTETLLAAARFGVGDVVVDVGCGQGASVELMVQRGIYAVGVDSAAAPMLGVVRQSAESHYVLADGAALPFRSASVDGILAECSLSTMTNRRHALAEWLRLLRPGGHLALSDVYLRDGAESETSESARSRMITKSAYLRTVREAGFCVERSEDRSYVLKEWVGRFIFQYGSLDALWGETGGCVAADRAAVLGYFLLIACKPAGYCEDGR